MNIRYSIYNKFLLDLIAPYLFQRWKDSKRYLLREWVSLINQTLIIILPKIVIQIIILRQFYGHLHLYIIIVQVIIQENGFLRIISRLSNQGFKVWRPQIEDILYPLRNIIQVNLIITLLTNSVILAGNQLQILTISTQITQGSS